MQDRIIFENIRDMNVEHVFACGQCFRWKKLPSGNWLGVVGNYACLAKLCEESGTLELLVSGGDREFWFNYFDLGTDYGAIKDELIRRDLSIKAATESGYGIRILRQDLYEIIISFIISQNNNIPRITKCIETMSARYGEKIIFDAGCDGTFELYGFPEVSVLAKAEACELAELKFGYRCDYVVAAAGRILEKGLPASYEELLEYLGIGPKVANCIGLFGLRDMAAFPIDTWVKKLMSDMYGFSESDVRGMRIFAEKTFGELGGIAQQYLFNHYRNVKNKA